MNTIYETTYDLIMQCSNYLLNMEHVHSSGLGSEWSESPNRRFKTSENIGGNDTAKLSHL
jgi:hypothetical protein